jgi:hypothetical protein
MKQQSFIGLKFGRLTVISEESKLCAGRWWLCHCDCGKEIITSTSRLNSSSATSCGCARADSIKKAAQAAWQVTTKWSGPHKQKLKWLLNNMKRRCYDKNNKRYADWGGRGITICSEWLKDSSSFFNWCISNGYAPGLWIDRIDNDGNYEPDNCRFVEPALQAINTRKNTFLEHDGLRLTISQWARKLNVRPQAIQHRIARNWETSRIFKQPFRRFNVHTSSVSA